MERVRVERELCIGAGECVRIAPATFQLGEDDIAVVTDAAAATDEQLAEAERKCPAGAVFLDESE
ncbi:MAG: 4Fe-4S single cluster domain [Thermoleophilaceae bacterium]|jgi:ferredoxin|nr:4Fe-4S single cluster domain [Thermoleophilaceae bacterium]